MLPPTVWISSQYCIITIIGAKSQVLWCDSPFQRTFSHSFSLTLWSTVEATWSCAVPYLEVLAWWGFQQANLLEGATSMPVVKTQSVLTIGLTDFTERNRRVTCSLEPWQGEFAYFEAHTDYQIEVNCSQARAVAGCFIVASGQAAPREGFDIF